MSFRLNQVTFRYDPTAPAALHDVTAVLPAGEVIAVLGPSGCGKTTLLNLLSLLWEKGVAAGEVVYEIGGEEFNYRTLSRDAELRARLRREQFGVVLQNCYLLPHFTCLQNLCLPLALQGWSEAEQLRWAQALTETVDGSRAEAQQNGLWSARARIPQQVSLGQKQRMAVLRAVAHNPHVVFADEPISNLDRTSTQAVLQLLLDWQAGRLHQSCAAGLLANPSGVPASLQARLHLWQKGEAEKRTLLLVCHHLDIAKACADRALLFDQGHRLVGDFTPDPSAAPAQRWAALDAQCDEVLRFEPFERVLR